MPTTYELYMGLNNVWTPAALVVPGDNNPEPPTTGDIGPDALDLYVRDVWNDTPIPTTGVSLHPRNSEIIAAMTSAHPHGRVANVDVYNAPIYTCTPNTRRFKSGDAANPLTVRFAHFGQQVVGLRNYTPAYVTYPAIRSAGTRHHWYIATAITGPTAGTAPDFGAANTFGQTVQDGGVTWTHSGSWDYGSTTTPDYGDCHLNGVAIPIPNDAKPSPGTDGWLIIVDPIERLVYSLWRTDFTYDGDGKITSVQFHHGSVTSMDGDGRSDDWDYNAQRPWMAAKISRASGSGLSMSGQARWAELQNALDRHNAGDYENAYIPHALYFSTNLAAGPQNTRPNANDTSGSQYPATTTDGSLDFWKPNTLYYEWQEVLRPGDRWKMRATLTHTSGSSYDASKWTSTGMDFPCWPIKEGMRLGYNSTEAEIRSLPTVFDQIWARTIKKMGVYCSDKGGAIFSTGIEMPWKPEHHATRNALGLGTGYFGLALNPSKLYVLNGWNGAGDYLGTTATNSNPQPPAGTVASILWGSANDSAIGNEFQAGGYGGGTGDYLWTQQDARLRIRLLRATANDWRVETQYRPFSTAVTGNNKAVTIRTTVQFPANYDGTQGWFNLGLSNNANIGEDASAQHVVWRNSPHGSRFIYRENGRVVSTANVGLPPGGVELEVELVFDQTNRKLYARWWAKGTTKPTTWNLTSGDTGADGSGAQVPFFTESVWNTLQGLGMHVASDSAIGTYDWFVGPITVTSANSEATPVTLTETVATHQINLRGDEYRNNPTVVDAGTYRTMTVTVAGGESGGNAGVDLPVTPGKQAKVKFRVRRAAGTARRVGAYIHHNRPSTGEYYNGTLGNSNVLLVTDAWQDMEITINVPSNSDRIQIVPIINAGAVGDAVDWDETVTITIPA